MSELKKKKMNYTCAYFFQIYIYHCDIFCFWNVLIESYASVFWFCRDWSGTSGQPQHHEEDDSMQAEGKR